MNPFRNQIEKNLLSINRQLGLIHNDILNRTKSAQLLKLRLLKQEIFINFKSK